VKSIDTNIIIRFLVNDNVRQGRLVRDLFLNAEKQGGSFYISTPVLLETLWVLKSVYEYSREEIIRAVESLSLMPVIEFENDDVVMEFIKSGRETNNELDDLLIGIYSKISGCETTLTLDIQASKSALFTLLR
jgi:predicted nucleic-acid-binding protein